MNTGTPHSTFEFSHRGLYTALAVLFAFVWFLSHQIADLLFRAIVVLFLVGIVARRKWIHADGMHLLCLAFCLVVVLGYVWHLYAIPEALFGGSRARLYLPAVCFFLLLAHGVSVPRGFGPFALLAAALLGLIAYLALQAPAQDWLRGWQGRRIDFGIHNAQHAGVLFGAGLLATIVLTPRIISAVTNRFRPVVGCVMVALVGLMIWGVMVTQVRAVWLGLAAAFATLLLFLLLLAHRSWKTAHSYWKGWFVTGVLVAGALLLVSLALFDAPNRVADRLAREEVSLQTLASAARFETEGRLSSTQVRVASWAAATEWIAQRPWFGWGGQTVKQLIRESPHFDSEFKRHFGHLHNSYLEVLVAIGWVGFIAIAAIVALVGSRSVVAWRKGWMPTDVFVLAWAFFLFWVTVNAFESYIVYPSGFFLNSVAGGFIYAFYLSGVETSERATNAEQGMPAQNRSH